MSVLEEIIKKYSDKSAFIDENKTITNKAKFYL